MYLASHLLVTYINELYFCPNYKDYLPANKPEDFFAQFNSACQKTLLSCCKYRMLMVETSDIV